MKPEIEIDLKIIMEPKTIESKALQNCERNF